MRTLDGRFLTEVANHPEVRPHLKGSGELDLMTLISDPANIALQFEGGGWFLQNMGGCVYEVHSMFLPEVRGAKVKKNLVEALRYVFIETDCVKIVTRLPKGNVAARALAKITGFRPWFVSGDEFVQLSIEDWIHSSYECAEAGQQFHHRLEAIKESHGSTLDIHEDDAAHDRAVGAAYLMSNCGNAAKGVWHYNQWARLAGYAPAQILSLAPLMIDMGDAILGRDMEVFLCR